MPTTEIFEGTVLAYIDMYDTNLTQPIVAYDTSENGTVLLDQTNDLILNTVNHYKSYTNDFGVDNVTAVVGPGLSLQLLPSITSSQKYLEYPI